LPELWICASVGPIKPPLATPMRRKIQILLLRLHPEGGVNLLHRAPGIARTLGRS